MAFTWTILVVLIAVRQVDAALTATTANVTYAEIGNDVIIGCKTNIQGIQLRWMHYKMVNGTVKFTWIHNGVQLSSKFADRFRVHFNDTTREGTMFIRDAQPNDTGMYNCSETNTAVKALTFRIEVLDHRTTTNDRHDITASDTRLNLRTPGPHYSTTQRQPEVHPDVSHGAAGVVNVKTTNTEPNSSKTNETTYIIVGLMGLLAFCLVVFAVLLIVVLNKRKTEVSSPEPINPTTGGNKLELFGVSDIESLFIPHTATLDYARINHTEMQTQTTPSPSAHRSSAGSSSPSHSYSQIADNIEQATPASRTDDDDGYSRLDQLAVRNLVQQPPTVYSRLGDGLLNHR